MENLYLLKNAIGFVFKAVPMLFKYLDKKIFPFDPKKVILSEQVLRYDKSINALRIFFDLHNYSLTNLEILSIELVGNRPTGLFFKEEQNIFLIIENRKKIHFSESISFNSSQFQKIQDVVKNNDKLGINILFKTRIRGEYIQFQDSIYSTVEGF